MWEESKRKLTDRDKVLERTETWADDQQNRSYYYDDAQGYEDFDPKTDDEVPEDDETEELS